MEVQAASEAFASLFPEAYRRFHRRVPHTAYRLTSESLAVVQHLADSGPLTVSEAGRHMNRSQAAMSELITRLVTRGLLDRMPDERDRRRVLVWLTPAGREALEEARSVLSTELLARAFSSLPAASRGQLIAAMQLLVASPRDEKEVSG